MSTSIAIWSAPWSVCSRSVAAVFQAPGPKAGGPHYLERFATERTITINTAAVGGNTSLLSLGD